MEVANCCAAIKAWIHQDVFLLTITWFSISVVEGVFTNAIITLIAQCLHLLHSAEGLQYNSRGV